MDFKAYLQKTIAAGGLKNTTFGSLTGNALQKRLENISLFSSANLEDLNNIDLEKLLSGEVKEGAAPEEQALGDIISALFDMEEVQSAADSDGDGEISEEEAREFLKNLMGNDGDLENFSIEDIDKAIENLSINLEEIAEKAIEESVESSIETPEAESVKAPETPQQRPVQQSAAPAGGGGNYTPRAASPTTGGNKTAQSGKSAETPEEIQALITEKEGQIDTLNTDADTQIAEQEKAKAEALKGKGISEEQQKQYEKEENDLEKKISDAEKDVQEKEKNISDWTSTVTSNKSYISSLESQISSNNTRLGSISDDDENAASKRSEIQAKTDKLIQEKEKVERENEKLEEKIKKEQDDVNELKNTTIPGYEKEKSDLLRKMVENSPVAKGGQAAIESAMGDLQQYDAKISEIREKRNTDVTALQGEIQELQVKLKNLDAKDDRNSLIRENSAEAPLFDPDLELSTQYITDESGMSYMLIGPKDADPNEELPVLMYLHGMGEVGKGEQGLYSEHGPGGIVLDWDMQNFNGYILCPQLQSGNWNNATAEAQLRSIMDNFTETHNTGKAVIMGASLGGSGATYMANHMGAEYFDEAVILSGYSGGVNDIQIPVTGYVASQDDQKSINIMKSQFGDNLISLEATHGTLPKALFTMDLDGDGCSDFLQRLFAKNY